MHRQPGHKAGQVVGVRSDIAQASARTAPFRIGSPIRLLLPGPFQRGRQPVLRVLYLNNAKRPEFARLHHLARLPHHRVAGVIVRQTKDQAGSLYRLLQVQSILECRRHRLVANHVDFGIQKLFRIGVVQMIRRDNGHHFNSVRAARFRRSHFLESSVRARNKKLLRGNHTFPRIRTQRRGNQFVAVIHARGNPVHGANKRARPASYHAQAQPPRFSLLSGITRHVCSPFAPRALAFADSLLRPPRILQSRRMLAPPSG